MFTYVRNLTAERTCKRGFSDHQLIALGSISITLSKRAYLHFYNNNNDKDDEDDSYYYFAFFFQFFGLRPLKY